MNKQSRTPASRQAEIPGAQRIGRNREIKKQYQLPSALADGKQLQGE
jgi:hypothetical protein